MKTLLSPPKRVSSLPFAPRISFAAAKGLWGFNRRARGSHLCVKYETWICDANGKILRKGNSGRNQITNFGMDYMGTGFIGDVIQYLVLSSASSARKRVVSGPTLTVTFTSPSSISVASDTSFFAAGDVGRTLVLSGVPELKITGFTSDVLVTCATPSGDWLPGFTPPGIPTNYTVATVFYTDINTLDTYFTQFNTVESTRTYTTDASNNRFVQETIFLSDAVAGSPWTVNQLGWSDGNASHNVFGVANLSSPDTVAVGQKYRVKLDVYETFTPVTLTGVTVDWGATIGSYTMDIRTEYIGKDNTNNAWLKPPANGNSTFGTGWKGGWHTGTHTYVTPYYEGQSGGTLPPSYTALTAGGVTLASYTAATYKRNKLVKWSDETAITGATAMVVAASGFGYSAFTLKPQTGTVAKPSGFYCTWATDIYWTRDLPV